MDYFPEDFLVIVDESHVTVPQIGGMYNGDRARKMVLVEHGFRLPSALDNRPLRFDEWEEMVPQVELLTRSGIPVMAHIGFTPQSEHNLGGYRVQGRDDANAERIRAEAGRLAEAGCFSIVLELLPAPLAADITRASPVPTIGIGAGAECDGQVLVLYDALGLNDEFSPKFLRRFADLAGEARKGVADYVSAVRRGEYPGPEHSHG